MKKRFRKILFVTLLILISYFGGGDKYISQAVDILVDTLPVTTDNKLDSITTAEKLESKNLKGTIIHVSDGDTVTLLESSGRKHKIRLNGIDAPEIGQPYGEEAKAYVERMVLHQSVEVLVAGTDQYKRILGEVYAGATNINEELLKQGLAWQYHFNKNSHYVDLVRTAKHKRLNIWSKSNSIDPYEWRKRNNR